MNLALWAGLLIIQNAAFTWVSRARNGGSYAYHAVAAVFSNGVFFAAQFLTIAAVMNFKESAGNPGEIALLGVTYVVSTVTGSVLMHWVSVKFLEKGKRRVGHA